MRGNVVIRIADGIMHYAKTRTNWEIQFQGFHPANENLQYFDSWHPDGLIAQAPMSENDPLLRNSSLKAIVFIDRPAPKHVTRQHAISISGNSEIGTMAAEFFLKQKFNGSFYITIIGDSTNNAISSISIISVAFFIVILFVISSNSFPYISFILFLIISSFPIKIISDSISFIALIAPFIFASGLLSPPHTIE